MFGMEVAGLVLGALPVLIEAIDGYKCGVHKLKSGFNKRKVVEKLGRALRYQESIMNAITRKVLVESGCDVAGTDDTQLKVLLRDKQTQVTVDDFLGTNNAQVFSDTLAQCMADISKATISLASLVPTLALVKNNIDVQAVLCANEASEKGQIQLIARLSMVLKLETLKHQIEALDRSTNSMDRFARNIVAGQQLFQSSPSRKATKLANLLQVVRQNAVNLHSALTRQWVTQCHQRHELKVFLEDRLTEPKPKDSASDARANCFRVAFVGAATQPTAFCHETLFYIEIKDKSRSQTPPPRRDPCVQFATCQPPPNNIRLVVQNICIACTTHQPIFHLTHTKNIAMTLQTQTASATIQSSQISSTTLQEVFHGRSNQNLPSLTLPWKWRMMLAVNISSSFLQFVRTPWVQRSWSATTMHILYKAGSQELDLGRPFLSADFTKCTSTSTNRQAQVREDLLELGILLLEIWHENNIEDRFAQQLGTNNVSFLRRSCALEWLDDFQNPLPDLYFSAVSHCVSGLIAPNPRASEWDHPDIWKSVCENVIEPLTKVARI